VVSLKERIFGNKPLEYGKGKGYKVTESNIGRVDKEYFWENRRPHPDNMSKYEDWGNDAESSVALEVLKDIIAGVDFYTEVDEKFKPKDGKHKNTVKIDEYCERVNLNEDLQTIVHVMLQKGFCPVEILGDYDLKIMPAETFFIHMDKKGKVLKYTQERSKGDVITEWSTPSEMASVVPFFFGWTPTRPYGKSLLEPIGSLLDDRAQMNEDMPAAIHRWAYPIPIMETSGPKAELQKACEDRDVDEWIFIGNAQDGDVRWKTLEIDPQARFIPYIEMIYYQIAEGLHAPLLLYLKNATEASATVMMESVDRMVGGVQRYVKRRVEKFLFKPQVGEPVPRLEWGQQETGLEDMTGQDVSQMLPFMAKNQQQETLKHFFSWLPEPDWKEDAELTKLLAPPMMPFGGVGQQGGKPGQQDQKPQPKPVELLAMRNNLFDLQTNLNIIVENFVAGTLMLAPACKLADKTISVHMKKMYGDEWSVHRDEQFKVFVKRLVPGSQVKKTYTVAVD